MNDDKILPVWVKEFNNYRGNNKINNDMSFFEMQQYITDESLSGKKIYPNYCDIYNAFKYFYPKDTRVVILGQDPYHEIGQANGLSFSVNNNVPLPPSLKNIFQELKDDLGGELRTNGNLSDWAEQGVLLLNSALSVYAGKANSMSDLWEPFTDDVIRLINEQNEPVIFILWGNNARKKKTLINADKHYVIESAHPSPLSAHRGFFGSKPFSKANQYLKKIGKPEIKWN